MVGFLRRTPRGLDLLHVSPRCSVLMPSTPRAAHPAGGACGAPGHHARHVVRGSYAGKRALAGQCPATTVDTLQNGALTRVIPYELDLPRAELVDSAQHVRADVLVCSNGTPTFGHVQRGRVGARLRCDVRLTRQAG